MKTSGVITYDGNIFMIDQIINELLSSDDDAQQSSIYLIRYAFEKYRGVDDGCIPVDIVDENFDKFKIYKLKNALQSYIVNEKSELNRSSAYFSLGKLHDVSLKEYFVKCLEKEVELSATAVFQIMVALRNIGEQVFINQESLSAFDFEENIMIARDYLNTINRIT